MIRAMVISAMAGVALTAGATTTPVPKAITFGQAQDIAMPAAFHVFSARLADWDGDGKVDVLASPATGGAIYLLRNIGTPRAADFDFSFGRPPLVGAASGRWTLFDSIEQENDTKPTGGRAGAAKPDRAPSPQGEGTGGVGGFSPLLGRTFDVADMDGDGDLDLLVSRGGRIAWLRNDGTKRAPKWSAPIDAVDERGERLAFKDFWYTVNPEAVDWDGDGRVDLLAGVWHTSRYVNGEIRLVRPREDYRLDGAHIYWLRNVGTAREPRYAGPVALSAENGVIAGLGIPVSRSVDWDGDGDLDLMFADFGTSIRYFENRGTRTQPHLVDRGLLEADGKPIASAEVFRPDPAFADLDGDGDLDLVVSGHGRAVMWFENTGSRTAPRLAFRGGLPARVAADTPLHLGNIITPVTMDVDGDGDLDILAGNEPGVITWAENTGTRERPVFAAARPILGVDGRPLEMFAKDLGMSMWGPLEDWDERTSPVPVDWDGDGRLDFVTNSMSGRVYWLRNAGVASASGTANASGEKAPRFEAPRPVLAAADAPLVSLPRSRAGIADWNGDGVPDVILPDARGVLTLYVGERGNGASRGGETRLTKRVALRGPTEDAIVMHPDIGEVASGRVQHEVIDWDGDGRLDLLASRRSDSTPRRYWVMWYRNVGTNAAPVLEGRELLHGVNSGHEAGLHAVDWNHDGVLDLLTGDQEGRVWWWDGRQLAR